MEESPNSTSTSARNSQSSVHAARSEEGRGDLPATDTTSRMSNGSGVSQQQQQDEESSESSSAELFHVETTESACRRFLDNYQKFRYKCGKIVNDKWVQLFIVILIAINAIMMGIGTYDFVTENDRINKAFEAIDTTFLVIYTIELVMQFIFYGWRLVLDGWLLFDFIIIVTSWSTWNPGSSSDVQIIRAFRIFRALRLITRIKVMKNLVLALFGVMPRMFAIGLLLFLVSYIFAVMFTQLFKDLNEKLEEQKLDAPEYSYFGRIDETFFTLFQIMTLDGWAEIARETMVIYAYAWLPFIVFVIITGFVVVNLIIAVICDAIAALHDDEKAKLHGTFEDSETSENESMHPAMQEDVREQLDTLENHVNELTSMQEQTLLTLETLARRLQSQSQYASG